MWALLLPKMKFGPAARENMLMKYAKVSKDGTYSPPPPSNSKASYSTMVYVRATIVEDAGWHLARAATISVSPSEDLQRNGSLESC